MKYAAYMLLICGLTSIVSGQAASKNAFAGAGSGVTLSGPDASVLGVTEAIRGNFRSIHEKLLNVFSSLVFRRVSQLEKDRDEELKAQIANGTLPQSADMSLIRISLPDKTRNSDLIELAQANTMQNK